jgi:hypothetical protein
MDGIQISLLDVSCLTSMQNVVAKKMKKWWPIIFGLKVYLWMKKYNIVVIVFNSDFEGEMNCLIPLCVHERVYLKNIWNKNLAKFSTFCKLQMTKHCCFPIFLEVKSFTPLNFDVIFRFNFSPCTNVCSPTLLLLWGWALNACLRLNALV